MWWRQSCGKAGIIYHFYLLIFFSGLKNHNARALVHISLTRVHINIPVVCVGCVMWCGKALSSTFSSTPSAFSSPSWSEDGRKTCVIIMSCWWVGWFEVRTGRRCDVLWGDLGGMRNVFPWSGNLCPGCDFCTQDGVLYLSYVNILQQQKQIHITIPYFSISPIIHGDFFQRPIPTLICLSHTFNRCIHCLNDRNHKVSS